MEKNLQELLETAIQSFPAISMERTGIEYDSTVFYARVKINNCFFSYLFPNAKNLVIEIGDDFIDLDRETQVACLIHELEHYERRNKENKELIKEAKQYLEKRGFKKFMGNITQSQRQRNKLLLDTLIQEEIYADDKIIKAGYGFAFLNLAKKVYGTYTSKTDKEIMRRRIEYLEKSLGTI